MPEQTIALNATLLLELEEIKQLKYRYLRAVDLKEWELLASTLTEDVTSSYSDGKHTFSGRKAVMDFLSSALKSDDIVTKHQCHHPEISFFSETRAAGVWYLTDLVINTVDSKMPITLQGTGFYEDEYRKENGQWKLCHTGYERVFEEVVSRKNLDVLAFKTRFD